MPVGFCDQELESILSIVTDDDMKELKAAAVSGDLARLKRVLTKYVRRRDCLDIESLKRHVVRRLISNYVGRGDYVTYEFQLDPPPGRSLASGMYPCFNIAELVYSSLYESDPTNAHERMYLLLEPILLDDRFTQEEKKSLFLPISASNWDSIQEHVSSVVEKLDAERREAFCRNLTTFFHLLLYCMNIEMRLGFTARIRISGRLVDGCPELKSFLSEGSVV